VPFTRESESPPVVASASVRPSARRASMARCGRRTAGHRHHGLDRALAQHTLRRAISSTPRAWLAGRATPAPCSRGPRRSGLRVAADRVDGGSIDAWSNLAGAIGLGLQGNPSRRGHPERFSTPGPCLVRGLPRRRQDQRTPSPAEHRPGSISSARSAPRHRSPRAADDSSPDPFRTSPVRSGIPPPGGTR